MKVWREKKIKGLIWNTTSSHRWNTSFYWWWNCQQQQDEFWHILIFQIQASFLKTTPFSPQAPRHLKLFFFCHTNQLIWTDLQITYWREKKNPKNEAKINGWRASQLKHYKEWCAAAGDVYRSQPSGSHYSHWIWNQVLTWQHYSPLCSFI